MGKTIVCACEDVTLDELRRAFEKGHRDVESLKRFTGFGTGPCQGKSCLAAVARELRRLGATQPELAPFTARPPLLPIPLGALAQLDPASLPTEPGVPLEPPHPERPRPSAELPGRAEVVIIGGGIMGLGLAYALCRRGLTDVVVLEGDYLNAGASGRNGGGVRTQWTTPSMIRLARRSIARMRELATELGVNVWLRQNGYLFLAPDAAQAARLERNLEVHEREGLRTRLLTPGQARELVPELDGARFVAAAYNPDDGTVFPWPFLWGYAARAEALGARVCTFTRVTGFEAAGRRISAVHTDRGAVDCGGAVVNAAGAWSKEVAALAGVAVPNRPTRHEILATEPLKPWLDPLVAVLGTGLYFSQTQRGEIVGGMGDPAEPEGLEMRSTLRFLARFARGITACAPITAGVSVIRQWAGCYDVTPDNNPILGPAGYDNFLQLHGFGGHGFMMAPAITEALAAWMAGGERDELFDRFRIERFAGSDIVREDFVIG